MITQHARRLVGLDHVGEGINELGNIKEERKTNLEAWKKELITIDIAEGIARDFRSSCLGVIREVYCFGSVARNGRGRDLDLILAVLDDWWRVFCDECWQVALEIGITDFYEGRIAASIRSEVIYNLLAPLPYYNEMCDQLDLFMLPIDWKSRLAELQAVLPNDDPKFMENIARDAILM